MKRLYVVRHAKSSWADMTMKDIDRPLNERGNRDAPIMASYLKRNGYVPDRMIASEAKRAQETAAYFAEEMNMKLTVEKTLYHAPEDTYFEVCYGLEESVNSVMLFGHNPGITYLANSISKDYIDNVATTGVLIIDSSADSWAEISMDNCNLKLYTSPKKLI